MTLSQIKEQLRSGAFAFPGGYPKFFIMADSSVLSFESVLKEFKLICDAHIRKDLNSCWLVAGVDINWEDSNLFCEHSNKPIESAYGESA